MIRSRRFLFVTFGLIAVCGVLVTLVASLRMQRFGLRARSLAENSLSSIRLIARMAGDVDHQRVLLDEHIFERAPEPMATIEAQIAEIQADIAAAAKAYEPWATFPGEHAAWEKTQADLAGIRQPIDEVLALSRLNRDAEAWQALLRTDTKFAGLDRDFAELTEINHTTGEQTLKNLSALRQRLLFTQVTLGLLTVLGTVVVGLWTARQVSRNEEALLLHSRLLEERNRDLDAFAAHVAHDLRGPITTINLATTRLAQRAPQESVTTDRLRRASCRMEALINDLLALARIETQSQGPCDPAEVAAQIGEDLSSRVDEEKATLRLAVEHAQVRCSGGLLGQALTNLIENALKYHRPEAPPEVALSGQVKDNRFELRVADKGTGMSSEEAAQLFTPFFRSPRVRELPGSGLGLSIVKRITEASGGTVSVETELRRGTTFVIRLPLA